MIHLVIFDVAPVSSGSASVALLLLAVVAVALLVTGAIAAILIFFVVRRRKQSKVLARLASQGQFNAAAESQVGAQHL